MYWILEIICTMVTVHALGCDWQKEQGEVVIMTQIQLLTSWFSLVLS